MGQHLWIFLLAAAAYAGELPRGKIIAEVKCAAEPSQSYALYLPSHYSDKLSWALILAFDPRARGSLPVQRFEEAAEAYGYIVAGSNNSRNGSGESSIGTLTTPHRVAIFEGGHTWLSSELAVDAIEWLHLQAMKSGRLAREEEFIDRLFAQQVARAVGPALAALVEDFQGLKDVSAFSAREAEYRRSKAFKDVQKKERAEEQHEEKVRNELAGLEAGLADHSRREASLSQLTDLLTNLARQAQAANDSSERRIARRTLRGAMLGSVENGADPEYRKLLDKFRSAAGGR